MIYDVNYSSLVISATSNTVVSVGPHVEKFNIVSIDHGSMHNCDFSDCKYPSLGKFGPKYQNCQFKLKFGT